MSVGPIIGAGIKAAKPVAKKVAKSLEKQVDEAMKKVDDLRKQWKQATDKKTKDKIANQGVKAKETLAKLQDKLQKSIEESGRVTKTGRTNQTTRGAADEKLSDSVKGVRRPKSAPVSKVNQLESELNRIRKQWTVLNNQLKRTVTKAQRDAIAGRKEKLTKMGQNLKKQLEELKRESSATKK